MVAAECTRPQAPVRSISASLETLLDPFRNALQGRRKGGPVLATTLGEIRTATALAADLTGDMR